jgi:hypothetical protein
MNKRQIEEIYNKWVQNIERSIGSKTTTTRQLQSAGKRLVGRQFVGVFASDRLPNLPPKHCAIINVDGSNEPGSHWLAITDKYMYDSYGRDINKLVKTRDFTQRNTERDAEQFKSEKNCGARCLAFCVCFKLYGNEAIKYL